LVWLQGPRGMDNEISGMGVKLLLLADCLRVKSTCPSTTSQKMEYSHGGRSRPKTGEKVLTES